MCTLPMFRWIIATADDNLMALEDDDIITAVGAAVKSGRKGIRF